MVHFDTCVNVGIRGAGNLLQRTAGVEEDGLIGPNTLISVNKLDDKEMAKHYIDIREVFYRSLVDNKPNLNKFLKGWINRCEALRIFMGA